MKRMILIACIAGMMAPLGLYAQKVYIEGDKVILDMTVEAGMPAEAVTDKSKTFWYNTQLATGEPKNNVLTIINGAVNNNNHELNAAVYQKLEISKNDPGPKTWVEAFNYCKNSEGVDWRLPTQRELMMMYIFKSALNDFLSTDFKSGDVFYWSSTETSYNYSLIENFSDGSTTSTKKTISNNVRCVREVNP